MSMAMRRYGLGLSLALAVPLVGCGHGHDPSLKPATTGEPAPVAVTVSPLERRTVERTVAIEGNLKAWEEVTVSAKKGGRVLKVHHDMGDTVAPGEPLVELDPVDSRLLESQAEARYLAELSKLGIEREQAEEFIKLYGISEAIYRGKEAAAIIERLPATVQAKATLDKTANELSRQEGLYNRGVGVLQDYQNAQKDVEAATGALGNVRLTAQATIANALSARAALDIAEQDLKEMTIAVPRPAAAPEGVEDVAELQYGITRRVVHEGQRIKDGDPLFEMVIDHPIRLWANVPERYHADIALGQTVRIAAQSRPGEVFEGKVARINPAVDPLSRAFQVEAVIPNPERKLRPGGFSKGEIVFRTDAESVVVPLEAVYRFAGVTKIFLIENERATGYPVVIGRVTKGQAEVTGETEPLPTTGQVVTTGQTVLAKLAEGTRVIVRDLQSDPSPPAPAAETTAAASH